MDKPLVSIIVTAYNVSKYIDECLYSICQQQYENIEVIVVDDGSTDGTGVICDHYANRDNRFRVIHQKNQGRVLARALGVKVAKGNYIGFIDGDDWIEPELYKYLIGIVQKYAVDMVASGYINDDNGICNVVEEPLEERAYKTPEEIDYVLANFLFNEDGKTRGMIWSQYSKLYKKNILKRIMDKVPSEMQFSEDCLLNILYILEAKSIYIGKAAYYHYRIHDESTVQRLCEEYLGQVNILFIELKKIFKAHKNHKALLKQLDKLTAMTAIRGLNQKIGLSGSTYIPWYMFDASGLEGKRVILYGAGAVGKDYCFQIQKQSGIKLVLWVDQRYQRYINEGFDVSDVAMIPDLEFDRILIGVKSEDLAKKITNELFMKYSVPRNRIVWKQPKEIYILDV